MLRILEKEGGGQGSWTVMSRGNHGKKKNLQVAWAQILESLWNLIFLKIILSGSHSQKSPRELLKLMSNKIMFCRRLLLFF